MIEIIPNWHPLFVHFTVALLSTAVGFFLLAWVIGNRPIQKQWLIMAHWNLWVGTGFALITAATGLFAYNTIAHDALSHAAMNEHRNWAFGTLAVLLPLTFWAWWNQRINKTIHMPFLGLALVLLGLLVSTAWHGGELVYRHGLGVMSLPTPEACQECPGHTHTEGTAGHDHSSQLSPVTQHANDIADEHHAAQTMPSDNHEYPDDVADEHDTHDHNHATDEHSH
ncbi:MAG TPA: DUF2231 domain-containing protein [Thiotrichaceae bacterium]|nr:DUF2231 domain-containing protein [Thiotrichaceae bacterium]